MMWWLTATTNCKFSLMYPYIDTHAQTYHNYLNHYIYTQTPYIGCFPILTLSYSEQVAEVSNGRLGWRWLCALNLAQS